MKCDPGLLKVVYESPLTLIIARDQLTISDDFDLRHRQAAIPHVGFSENAQMDGKGQVGTIRESCSVRRGGAWGRATGASEATGFHHTYINGLGAAYLARCTQWLRRASRFTATNGSPESRRTSSPKQSSTSRAPFLARKLSRLQ
jgi:hypothetical protein